jgi:hypothetical protein
MSDCAQPFLSVERGLTGGQYVQNENAGMDVRYHEVVAQNPTGTAITPDRSVLSAPPRDSLNFPTRRRSGV